MVKYLVFNPMKKRAEWDNQLDGQPVDFHSLVMVKFSC
jgi:hypothetical protein